MKKTVLVVMVVLFGSLSATAFGQSLFDRCQQEKTRIDGLKTQLTDIGNKITGIDQQLADLARRMRELRADRSRKVREKTALTRRIRRQEAMHNRRCRGLKQCERLEKQVARLRKQMQPLSDRLRQIRDGIRARHQEINDLNRDVDRLENQYNHLGCANLQIGQTAQSTFDKCSQLSRDWNGIQGRINRLLASVRALRQNYQQVMKKMRASSVQLSRLLKKFRANCSHSTESLATLESMEKDQHEYNSIKSDLDQMDVQVRKFRKLKLRPAKVKKALKPTLRPKKDKGNKGKNKHTMKPVK